MWLHLYTPTTGTQWRCAYSLDNSIWNVVTTTPSLLSDHGEPQSELSHYGNADASNHAFNLMRAGSGGVWSNWTAMRCSAEFPNSITDWDAHLNSATDWSTVNSAVVGAC